MAGYRELNRLRFGPIAERYVRSPDHARGDSLDRLIAEVRPESHWLALDVATGGGHAALAIAPHVREVLATDLTAEMLTAAEAFHRGRGITNIRYREADAMALPFDDGSFHLVVCRIAPHHFPDCGRFVREAARVLRPGGVAAVIDNVVPEDPEAGRFINDFERLRDPSHHWAHSVSDWERFYSEAGIRVRRAERFRKERDFEGWAGMVDADDRTRARLAGMLREAPPAAREALAPAEHGGRLVFWFTELLIVGSRAAPEP